MTEEKDKGNVNPEQVEEERQGSDAQLEDVKPQEETAPQESGVDKPVEEKKQPADHTVRGLVGRKLGMTQVFDKEGNVIPVTIVETGPCTVLELKQEPAKIKMGFGAIKEQRLNKPQNGFFKKNGVGPFRIIKEFVSSDVSVYSVGSEIKADVFRTGDYVDVTGISIGKGFQGGMKRHGWAGGPGGHGSNHRRRVGSIGASADPSRTVKGFPMPGHMGAQKITTQGLRVMAVDVENNLIIVKGSVPGCKNAIVSINKSFKKQWRSLDEQKAVVKHKANPMKQSKAKAKGKAKG